MVDPGGYSSCCQGNALIGFLVKRSDIDRANYYGFRQLCVGGWASVGGEFRSQLGRLGMFFWASW